MAGIAGIDRPARQELVAHMLDKIAHQGRAGRHEFIESRTATLGAVSALASSAAGQQAIWASDHPLAPDAPSLAGAREPFACAVARPGSMFLARDRIGVRPLYYGYTDTGAFCFASEVKALLAATPDVHEFPPGTWYDSLQGFHGFALLESGEPLPADAPSIAASLRQRLAQSVLHCLADDVMGGWLSGGLDSSALATLARPHVRALHTFAGGLAPDLDYARLVARFLGTQQHQIIVTFNQLLQALPQVIYHLESFDALLVRSTLMNYTVSRHAAGYVDQVLSSEGGDELFAGYHYLKELPPDQLLPPQFKLWRDGELIEKWILRQALDGTLPEAVLWRSKAKFWQGAGMG